MEKAKIVSTPLATHSKLSAAMSPKSEHEKKWKMFHTQVQLGVLVLDGVY